MENNLFLQCICLKSLTYGDQLCMENNLFLQRICLKVSLFVFEFTSICSLINCRDVTCIMSRVFIGLLTSNAKIFDFVLKTTFPQEMMFTECGDDRDTYRLKPFIFDACFDHVRSPIIHNTDITWPRNE